MNRDPGQVRVLRGWRRLLMVPLALLLRLWCTTLRWKASPASIDALHAAETPRVILLWHEHLFVAPSMFRRYRLRRRPLAALVSASNDGAWFSAAIEALGITPARGSSSRRALAATRELLDRLEGGHDVCLTPDGPRGPRRRCKVGPVFLGRAADTPFLLVGVRYGSAWKLRSWDGFRIPRPFSTVTIEARTITGLASLAEADDEATAARLSAELDRLDA